MDILQATLRIRGHINSQVMFVGTVPALWHILGCQFAFDELALDFGTDDNVHVITDFIGIHTDEGAVHVINLFPGLLHSCLSKLLGESSLQLWKEVLPKGL